MTELKLNQYVRKPFIVDAVRVTLDNMEDVGKWCGGSWQMDKAGKTITPYLQVDVNRPLNERQSKAYAGDWVLKMGSGYKVYTDKAFRAIFESWTGDRAVYNAEASKEATQNEFQDFLPLSLPKAPQVPDAVKENLRQAAQRAGEAMQKIARGVTPQTKEEWTEEDHLIAEGKD